MSEPKRAPVTQIDSWNPGHDLVLSPSLVSKVCTSVLSVRIKHAIRWSDGVRWTFNPGKTLDGSRVRAESRSSARALPRQLLPSRRPW